MRRLTISAAAALAAALLTAAIATGNASSDEHASNVAARQCTADQKADRAAFNAVWGDHAMRTCIHGTIGEAARELRANGRADVHQDVSEFKNAAKECRSERDADSAAFQATYGSLHSQGHNAFGKCVSSKAHSDE